MTVDYDRPPADFFFTPGHHPGLSLLAPLPPLWRSAPTGRIVGRAVTSHDHHDETIRTAIWRMQNNRRFSSCLALPTVPAVLDDVAIDHAGIAVGGRWLLGGAADMRLRNRYAWNGGDADADAAAVAHFARVAASGPPPPPMHDGEWRDLPAVVVARNLFNYYHFITETLGHIGTFAGTGHRGPIIIHTHTDRCAAFARAFVDALYPDLAPRVRFAFGPAGYDRCVTSWTPRHDIHTMPDPPCPSLDPVVADAWRGRWRPAHRTTMTLIAMNAHDAALRGLRARALAAVARRDTSHLPRRAYILRAPDLARPRQTANEDALLTALAPHGVTPILMETLSPLDQIALAANAELLIGPHGAGLANMAFAAPTAHVIELGTAQTAQLRWEDFVPLAHLSGCHYTTFFADFNANDPAAMPDLDIDGHIPVALAPRAVDAVRAYVEDALARPPQTGAEADFADRAGRLNRAEDWDALAAHLSTAPDRIANDPDLCVAAANAARARNDLAAAFDHLERADTLDPTRPMPVERMIRLARRLRRWPVAQALLKRHADTWPARHADLRRRLGIDD